MKNIEWNMKVRRRLCMEVVNMDIRQIAQKAGVSVATVSRVQNHPETVAPATLEKVQAIIEEYQYTPNWFARGMNLGKGDTIGLIVPDILNPSYMEIVKGIEEIVYKHGYITLMCNGDGDSKQESDSIDNLLKRSVDGLIVLSTALEKEKLISIRQKGIPIVSIGESNAGSEIDTVKIDYREATHNAIKHLVGMGYRSVAIINGPISKIENQLRLKGYEEILESAGIPIDKKYIISSKISMENGYIQAKKLLKLDKLPRAIFATDDVIAMGVMAALRDEGIRVPEDIAIVGFDNINIIKMMESKLTTVENPLYRQGIEGAKLLLELIESGNTKECVTKEILLKTKLKIRKSCGYKTK
ncbi:LacI family DNA-binding transcriptional regulator [Terrisporobacter petrolearius]|uniref:LacI family DNA-binding transcriptional regulator n=1 Tax=Terrisporobacter petrolearius TaxID=1460447 RepID=UPI003AFF7B4F